MKSAYHMLLILVISLVLSGCSDRKQGSETSSTSISNKVVFAIVEGKELTVDFVKDTIRLGARIRELKTGKKGVKFGRWSNLAAMRILPQLLQAMILENDLDQRKIYATPESDAEILAIYNKKTNSKAATVDELARKIGELGPFFKQQFARESRFAAMYKTIPELKVEEKDITDFYHSLSNQAVRCQKINNAAKKRINKAWEELKGGRAWADVATNYTEDVLLEKSYADNWKDWQSLSAKSIEPPELLKAIQELSEGGFTKPLELEEGYAIVRLVSKSDDLYSLARILVRAAIPVDIPEREEAMRMVKFNKRHDFQLQHLSEVRKRMKIEYPLGKSFKYKIWEEAPVRRNLPNMLPNKQ